MVFVKRKQNRSRQQVLMSSATEHWQTGDEVLDLVREMGPIILDPCAAQDPHDWFAELNYNGVNAKGVGADGLHETWKIHNAHGGIVFANQPYSMPVLDAVGDPVLNDRGKPKRQSVIHLWTRKAVVEARAGAEIIMLTPSRTDTKWYHGDLLLADAWCFWRGRMRFRLPGQVAKNSATFPSLLTYFGPHRRLFYETFRHRGRVMI